MDINKLWKILKSEPKYRLKQANQVVFLDLIENWQAATVFPLALRDKLNTDCPLKIDAKLTGSEKSLVCKALIKFEDGLAAETVLMRHKDARNTICVSSQVGCPLACTFCATGQMGFKRNLSASEIITQVLFFARYLKQKNISKVTNIVFMGMGEPFLNYDNVVSAIKILNDKDGFNLGMRHFSISTIGLPGTLKKIAKDLPQVNLAISLHASDDKLRAELMPATKNFSLKKLFAEIDEYTTLTRRQVMFEYLLIGGINDRPEQADALARILNKPLDFLNLIRYNDIGKYKKSSTRAVNEFKKILEKHRIKFGQRFTFGDDIQAACGQLVAERGRD